MQTFLFLIFSFIFSPMVAQTKVDDLIKYKVIYELTYQPDSTNLEDVRKEEFLLYKGDKVSIFASKGRILRDSLVSNIKLNGTGVVNFEDRAKQTKTDFGYVIYKGFPYQKTSFTYKILRDNLRYEEDPDLFSWEIFPETKEIKGYAAQKATTSFAGRNYIAWFTPEIPIPDGPYKFKGLPGLILEIGDTQKHYNFTITNFESFKKPFPFEIDASDFIKTDKKKLMELRNEYKQNPLAVLERNNTAGKTITINFKEGQKEKLLKETKEKMEKENNPIELN